MRAKEKEQAAGDGAANEPTLDLREIGRRGAILEEELPAIKALCERLKFKTSTLSELCLREDPSVQQAFAAVYAKRPQKGAPAASWPALMDALGVGVDTRVWGRLGDEESMTLAEFACWQNKSEVLALIADRIDLRQKDSHGRGLVQMAASYGSAKSLKILKSKGVSMDERISDEENATPLMVACGSCGSGRDACIEFLATPARCQERNSSGMTPLMILCLRGRAGLLAMRRVALMSDLTAQSLDGRTALHFALEHGQTKPERAGPLLEWSLENPQYYADSLLAQGGMGLLGIADGLGRLPEQVARGEFFRVPNSQSLSDWMRARRLAEIEAKEMRDAIDQAKSAEDGAKTRKATLRV